MLSYIHIRDFTIIKQLQLDLRSGMNVLTGETGAGKSILIDAIGLVLGDRADSNMVRSGASRADITLEVELSNLPRLRDWLQEHDLNCEHDCLLRRVVHADGGSKAYINGIATSVALLRTLGEHIVDIHGQHAHQSLMKKDQQRILLDQYIGLSHTLSALQEQYSHWRVLKQKIHHLKDGEELRQARIQQLHFDIEKLAQLDLAQGEIEQLHEEHARLANASSLIQCCEIVAEGLYTADNDSLYDVLSQHIRALEEQRLHDEQLHEPMEQLVSVRIQLQEVAEFLHRYQDRLDLNPTRLQWIEERLSAAHDLARKHHVNADELILYLAQWQTELEHLESDEFDINELKKQYSKSEQHYRELAATAHEKRTQAAAKLATEVTANMQKLGMQGGAFSIELNYHASAEPTAHGLDKVQMMICTNPGQPMQPLIRVASGGELSRISLAIQMAAIAAIDIPCLIFDEVDSGIGGSIAETVGKQLRHLGEYHQVLCVTHLPQVAAQAHHHYRIHKNKQEDSTHTSIMWLNEQQRIEEVARMLGGQKITAKTLEHAAEMVQCADP